ncbi:MAG: hypothetical protein NDI69_08145 [Bacteriovoracaceae bacterium]|nr:hypothetical protein [Bacteriovoracaceae bacterium]
MSSSNIPIVKFLMKGELPVSGYESEEITSASDLATYLSTVPAALIIASLSSKEDLLEIATFMKLSKKTAKTSVFKIAVLDFSHDSNLGKAINKLGIQDLIEPSISAKGLKFKIDYWMKSLKVQAKNIPSVTAPIWAQPLELEDDIWILKNDNDCKKVLNKWLVRLLGPGTAAGQWVELKASLWRFDFKDEEKERYVGGQGAWFFYGENKPEFVWKENTWIMTGENFELYFKTEDQSFSRLHCKNRNLTICKNSLFAKTKESMILESFNKELVFKQEAQKLQELEGKNSTDHLDGNLSGDSEGATAESGFWKNKNSYVDEGQRGDHSLDSTGSRKGENLARERKDSDHQKHYKNHNEAEAYEAGKLSGKNGQQEKLDGFYRNGNASDEAQKNSDDELESDLEQKLAKVQHERKAREATASSEEKERIEKVEATIKRKLDSIKREKLSRQASEGNEKSLEELTSEINVSSKLSQKNKCINCHLDDYFDEMLVFRTQQDGIKAMEPVQLEMVVNYLQKDSQLQLEADVLTVEDDGEGNNYITVKIDKNSTDAIGIFIQLFEIRQNNINEFMKKAKGL